MTFCLFSGQESIHREFKKLRDHHGGLNDPVKRLKSMLQRHHINVFPEARNKDLTPQVHKRGPYKTKAGQTVLPSES